MTLSSGKPLTGPRRVYPVLLPFPIWRYGRLHIGYGWYPDWYETREIPQ